MRPLVIFHADCNDGLTAAWVVSKVLHNADYHPAKHGSVSPEITGREVVMVDFSYKRPIVEAMLEVVESLTIIDHHITTVDELKDLKNPKLELHLDMDRSGAGMAWDILNPLKKGKRPPIVDYVEDYDLGRTFKGTSRFENTTAVIEALRSMPRDFQSIENANAMLENPVFRPSFIALGEGIVWFKERMVEYACGFASRVNFPTPDGIANVWVTNAPYFLSSEVGNKLAEKSADQGTLAFGASYYWDGETQEYRMSLRSKEGGADVSKIARHYGGGGHKNASGFQCKNLPWVSK